MTLWDRLRDQERVDVLLSLTARRGYTAEQLRNRLELLPAAMNRLLGHLRWLENRGLALRSANSIESELRWFLTHPAGCAAADLLRLSHGGRDFRPADTPEDT